MASSRPKARQAPKAGTGRQRPKMMAARAMKPCPAVMSRLNPEKVKAMAAAVPEPVSNYNPANDATNAFEPINEPLNLDDAGADLDKSRIN